MQIFQGSVLDQIEAGSDLEVYYEDVKDADFSASALFYAKATLNMFQNISILSLRISLMDLIILQRQPSIPIYIL